MNDRVFVYKKEKIFYQKASFKTNKKGSSQRGRQIDGMSNKWTGATHVKHVSKDNNGIRTKLKPGDPCGGKVMDVSVHVNQQTRNT